MKNLKYIIIFFTALVLNSCDDYLDIEPKGQVILTNVDEYNGIFDDVNFLHGDYFINSLLEVTDEYWPFNDNDIINDANPVTTANFLWEESIDRVSNKETDLFYEHAYARIARYNIIIEEVMDAEGDEVEKKEVFAKAQILRAFNHFLLINTYATSYDASTAASDRGIIVVKTFDLEQELVQSTVQDAYDFILADINAALPVLATVTDSPMHPNKAFAYALLAKVQLFMKDFPAALDAANESLSYNDFIFDMVDWHNQGSPSFPVPRNPAVEFDATENLYYSGGKWGRPSGIIGQTAIDWFGTGDIRLDDFYASPWWLPAPEFKLWFARDYMYNVVGIKSSEVLLMKAECMARNGNFTGAMVIVNALRIKRIMPADYVDLTAVNSTEAVNIIVEERARELLGSPNRLWDMRRLNTEAEFERTYTKVFNGQTYTLNPGSHLLIMPFAKTATNKNPSLEQNTN